MKTALCVALGLTLAGCVVLGFTLAGAAHAATFDGSPIPSAFPPPQYLVPQWRSNPDDSFAPRDYGPAARQQQPVQMYCHHTGNGTLYCYGG